MRAAFLNPSGPRVPDLAKCEHYGITRLYWLATDPNLTAALMADLAPKIELGIMRGPRAGDLNAVDLARELDADLHRVGRGGYGVQCAVLPNIEYPQRSAAYLLAFLAEWRGLRPWRDTAIGLEYHQGGWFTPELVQRVNADRNLLLVPEAYTGDPPTDQDPDLARCDLIVRGVDRGKIPVFYTASQVRNRESWDGIVFRLDQLP